MHKNGELKDLVVTTVNTNNIVAVESSINPKGMSSKLLNSATHLAESILKEYTKI